MTVKVAINGFGRIGRNVLRAVIESYQKEIEIVAINDSGPINTNVHLLKYDSIHGRLNSDITIINDDTFEINDMKIKKLSNRNPIELEWGKIGADIILECTGKFNNKIEAQKHMHSGAKKVLISAPAKNADITSVYGVNHKQINKDHLIISNASCTTNALAPLAAILHKKIGIDSAFMTTIHSYTGDQPTLDRNHKDLYRARSAAQSIIPTTTGAAKAVGEVIPELSGKIDGVAMRVPTPNVSVIDLNFVASRDTTVEEINNQFSFASENDFKNIISVTDEKLVSIDINHDKHSAILALDQTKLINKRFGRIMAWYDNEWGFSHRMCDMAIHIGNML
ncbi:MAG: type I glyceraldehyde-3-phosphate dehydrogenase [Rhizobiales bacterium]|jgi:glyceraldehyde 3-phosphate dehydrogenase|nr:type I glyceraldehyde-3-phosphate dehydrogenase [Hyphomicrobiales bacterium]